MASPLRGDSRSQFVGATSAGVPSRLHRHAKFAARAGEPHTARHRREPERPRCISHRQPIVRHEQEQGLLGLCQLGERTFRGRGQTRCIEHRLDTLVLLTTKLRHRPQPGHELRTPVVGALLIGQAPRGDAGSHTRTSPRRRS
jgi:hypothetical protein